MYTCIHTYMLKHICLLIFPFRATHNSKHSSNSGCSVFLCTLVCCGPEPGNSRFGSSSITTKGSLKPGGGEKG